MGVYTIWGVGVYGVWECMYGVQESMVVGGSGVILILFSFDNETDETFLKRFSHTVYKTYQRGLACFDKLIFATLTFGILRRCGGAFFAVVFHCFDVR